MKRICLLQILAGFIFKSMAVSLVALFLAAGFATPATAQKAIELSDEQVENIVRRSYQYVAMFNVIQKFALDPASDRMFTDGFNKPKASTALADHNMTSIARPNNDTLYQLAVLDLRLDPVIIEFPVIDSKYVALETSGYDHYIGVPLATSEGDFKKPTKVLFYTDRTEGYQWQKISGVDRVVKTDGDFFVAFLRAMPHQADPARMKRIIQALESVKVLTLSEFQGKPAKDYSDVKFPAYGKSDADIFANNLLEVMQFVFNHTTFDPNNDMDQALLAAYKPFGIEPGKTFDGSKGAELKGPRLREAANEVAQKALVDVTNPEIMAKRASMAFMPKGQIDLETQVLQSVTGPIGLPAYQARYHPVIAKDGKPMNARHDYVLKMSRDDLPPATAFWSLTLYDQANGFFIPNDQMKYSVGENAGFKLNAEGGIEIFISAKKPEEVPNENWLPINRGDIELSLMYRIYAPDAEKMKTWKMAQPEVLLSMASVESDSFENQVAEYLRKFPYQETFDYAMRFTGGDPAKLNTWVLGIEPALIKAGEDTVVRMNNDTYYKGAFLDLENGSVVLGSNAPAEDRFNSFQLIDDRNANYRNVIHPKGKYTLYFGEKPEQIQGEAIEVPSSFSVVAVRVEVKDKDDPEDVAAAKAVFNGITIAGEPPSEFPSLDLLSGYPADVTDEANRRMDEAMATVPFTDTIVGPGQEPGRDVPVLNHSAGTKGGWGGPHPSHSAYESIFFDKNGDKMMGSNGTYTVTTEEPPVDAFWSITVYDTDRGGFLHPNDDDRYHINNTAATRNDDGTVTFTFKQDCESLDLNCLEVPAGRFDLITRYYLPHDEVITGDWTWPKIVLQAD